MKYVKGIYLIQRIKDIENGEPVYYIGQSNNIFKRLQSHLENAIQEIDNSIYVNGIENFIFQILELVEKQSDRDLKEQYYINKYIEKYSASKLYNRTTGSKDNFKLLNTERDKLDKSIEQEIKNIFEKQINYPIYLVAEQFNSNFEIIINIRKPIMAKQGIVYNYFKRQIIYKTTNEVVPNWNADRFTNKQLKLYNENKHLENEQLSIILNASMADLKTFRNKYDEEYITAEKLVDTNKLNN